MAVSIPQPTPDFDIEEYLAKVTTPVAADLRKIILFDVAYEKIKDDEVRFETFENPLYVPIPRIKGRLRNELPRKIRSQSTKFFIPADLHPFQAE